jgi:hypothetical protein
MEEKRRLRRYTKRCEVAFSSQNVTVKAIARNFSLSGLFIRTNRPFAPDTMLDMEVYLPDGTTSQLKGTVKWFRKTQGSGMPETQIDALINGMGVAVFEKDAKYLDLISSLLI